MRLKILRICFVIVIALLNWNQVSLAQCAGGKPLQTVTYTSTNYLGSLTDSIYFPYKFNPAMGTLMGADMSISTLGYALLEVINDVGAAITYKITYYRTDYINGPGLGAGLMLDTTVVFNGINIGASDNPAVATSNPPWMSNGPNADYSNYWGTIQAAPVYTDTDGDHPRTFNVSIDPSDFGQFTGTDPLIYYYDVIASLLAQGVGGRYTQRIVTLNTEVTISTTYTYCPMDILPEGKLTFSARKTDNSNIALNWIKDNEQSGITYIPEMSVDGYNFSSIGIMQSQQPEQSSTVVKYEMDYAVPKSVNGKLYFRLKETNANGQIRYSAIKTVAIENIPELALAIYPNPAETRINLQFSAVQNHNLQAELINSIGQIVEKSILISNSSQHYTMNFSQKHQSGIYFIRVTNPVNKTQYSSRLVIR